MKLQDLQYLPPTTLLTARTVFQDCFIVFGAALAAMKLVWRKPLLLSDGSMHHALLSALRGAQIPVVP